MTRQNPPTSIIYLKEHVSIVQISIPSPDQFYVWFFRDRAPLREFQVSLPDWTVFSQIESIDLELNF